MVGWRTRTTGHAARYSSMLLARMLAIANVSVERVAARVRPTCSEALVTGPNEGLGAASASAWCIGGWE